MAYLRQRFGLAPLLRLGYWPQPLRAQDLEHVFYQRYRYEVLEQVAPRRWPKRMFQPMMTLHRAYGP